MSNKIIENSKIDDAPWSIVQSDLKDDFKSIIWNSWVKPLIFVEYSNNFSFGWNRFIYKWIIHTASIKRSKNNILNEYAITICTSRVKLVGHEKTKLKSKLIANWNDGVKSNSLRIYNIYIYIYI